MSTRTVTSSILTGTHPSRHQTWSYTEQTEVHAVPEELGTAPELLAERGYTTAAISRNAHFSSGTGLDRGFDEFEFLIPGTLLQTVDARDLLEWVVNVRRHSAGFTTDLEKHSTAFFVNAILKRKIEAAADPDPQFVYAHYNEPHSLYYPPRPYLNRYVDDIELDLPAAIDVAERMHHEVVPSASRAEFTDAEWEALEAMYDAEIAYTDSMVGEVYDYLRTTGLENAIVVVTADHGDLFGEYGLAGHMHALHDGLVHVPMVVAGPAADEIPDRSGDLLQHADVMKTVLELAGADTSQFQATDLRDGSRERAVSQRAPTSEAPPELHNSMLTAIRTSEHKFLYSDDGEQLYALPDETNDVSRDRPELTENFREYVRELLRNEGRAVTDREEGRLDENMEQHLRDMGYL